MELKKNLFTSLALFFLAVILWSCYSPPEIPEIDPVTALFIKAEEAIVNGEYSKAVDHLNEILLQQPSYTKAFFLRASAFEFMAENQMAQKDLERIIELEPRNSMAHFNFGNILFKTADYEKAIYHYTLALAFKQNYFKPYLNRANAYMKLEKYRNAMDDYKKYIEFSDYQKNKILQLINLLEQVLGK